MKPTQHMPAELARRLQAFERRLRLLESGTAIISGVAGALCTLLLLAILDRVLTTPITLRIILAAAGALAAAIPVTWWMHHWLWRRRDAGALARLVQRQYPKLGDRLLGAVELSGSKDSDSVSPALLRAALQQVTREAQAYDFRRAVPTRPLRLAVSTFILTLLMLAAGIMFAPDALRRSVQRWLRPTEDLDRYTFVQLHELPDVLVVPRGEPFDLACLVDPGSRWIPLRGQARIERQAPIRARIQQRVARFTFPGQLTPARLAIRIGDARRTLTIQPLQRPELVAVTAHIEWPAYLQQPPASRRVERGRITLLEDARVSFVGQVSREIGAAHLLMDEAAAASSTTSLQIAQNTFSTEARTVRDWLQAFPASSTNTAAFLFQWADPSGMREVRPFRLQLQSATDNLPIVQLEGIQHAIAALPHEVVALTARAQDDFGLAVLGLEWARYKTISTETGESLSLQDQQETVLSHDTSGTRIQMQAEHRVSPQLLDAEQGDIIMLRAWTKDFHPTHERVYTQPVYIQVYSYEDHAKLLLAAMQRVANRIEDLLRDEETLLATHEAIRDLDDEALALARTAQLLQQGEQGERRNMQESGQLAMDIDSLVQDALRNPNFEASTIQPWIEAAERMRHAGEKSMSQAAQALSNAQEQESARRPQLEDAIAHEKDAIEMLRQAANNIQQAIDSAQARNFVNRLRELATQELEALQTVRNSIPRLIGLPTTQLDPDDRLQIAALQRTQTTIQQEALYIRDDLGAFFLRTRDPVYETIRAEMADPDVTLQIAAASAAIGDNLLVTVAPLLDMLSGAFERWAAMLESDSACGADGEGSGEQEGLEQDVLIGLMRARVWEEMLREQTRALSSADHDATRHEAGSQRAAERQREIGLALRDLASRTALPDAAQWIESLSQISDEITGRLENNATDAATIAAQTEIIESIAQAIQGQSSEQESAESASGAEEQSAAAGAAPGEGGTGGSAAGTGSHTGPGTGEESSRTGERGSGDPASWPTEFRDAIQRYYEALETNQ